MKVQSPHSKARHGNVLVISVLGKAETRHPQGLMTSQLNPCSEPCLKKKKDGLHLKSNIFSLASIRLNTLAATHALTQTDIARETDRHTMSCYLNWLESKALVRLLLVLRTCVH